MKKLKVLINYKKNEQGQKSVISTQKLFTTEKIDFEILEVSDTANINDLEYDSSNNLVEDLEKQKLIEEIVNLKIENSMKNGGIL